MTENGDKRLRLKPGLPISGSLALIGSLTILAAFFVITLPTRNPSPIWLLVGTGILSFIGIAILAPPWLRDHIRSPQSRTLMRVVCPVILVIGSLGTTYFHWPKKIVVPLELAPVLQRALILYDQDYQPEGLALADLDMDAYSCREIAERAEALKLVKSRLQNIPLSWELYMEKGAKGKGTRPYELDGRLKDLRTAVEGEKCFYLSVEEVRGIIRKRSLETLANDLADAFRKARYVSAAASSLDINAPTDSPASPFADRPASWEDQLVWRFWQLALQDFGRRPKSAMASLVELRSIATKMGDDLASATDPETTRSNLAASLAAIKVVVQQPPGLLNVETVDEFGWRLRYLFLKNLTEPKALAKAAGDEWDKKLLSAAEERLAAAERGVFMDLKKSEELLAVPIPVIDAVGDSVTLPQTTVLETFQAIDLGAMKNWLRRRFKVSESAGNYEFEALSLRDYIAIRLDEPGFTYEEETLSRYAKWLRSVRLRDMLTPYVESFRPDEGWQKLLKYHDIHFGAGAISKGLRLLTADGTTNNILHIQAVTDLLMKTPYFSNIEEDLDQKLAKAIHHWFDETTKNDLEALASPTLTLTEFEQINARVGGMILYKQLEEGSFSGDDLAAPVLTWFKRRMDYRTSVLASQAVRQVVLTNELPDALPPTLASLAATLRQIVIQRAVMGTDQMDMDRDMKRSLSAGRGEYPWGRISLKLPDIVAPRIQAEAAKILQIHNAAWGRYLNFRDVVLRCTGGEPYTELKFALLHPRNRSDLLKDLASWKAEDGETLKWYQQQIGKGIQRSFKVTANSSMPPGQLPPDMAADLVEDDYKNLTAVFTNLDLVAKGEVPKTALIRDYLQTGDIEQQILLKHDTTYADFLKVWRKVIRREET